MRGAQLGSLALAVVMTAPVFVLQASQTARADVNDPVVVIAHIDGGINPYHVAFRDESPRAYVHPSEYIAGYPADTPALWLSLNEPDWQSAFEKDRAIWDGLLAQWNNTSTRETLRGKMFWIPGTKIVGALRMNTGGVYCPAPFEHPPPMLLVFTACLDRPILDDHGHATMTAARMAGNEGSLCPSCRIVSIEGLGGRSTRWAAEQGWIDVQTNSWLNLIPPPVNQAFVPGIVDVDSTTEAFAFAQSRMLTFAASGNGAAYILGYAPTPTWILSTAAPGVILVGAHDNGHVTKWSGMPAHVVADGYGGVLARNRHLTEFAADPFACCTSAASPYAAGGGAEIIRQARLVLGDTGTGLRDTLNPGGQPVKAIAVGTPPAGIKGPLKKGYLTLEDAREIVLRSTEARPLEGENDGLLHWTATGDPTPSLAYIQRWGTGANPYCGGCVTDPVEWADVPDGVPAYASIGYGAVNERSVAFATDVLLGLRKLPDRGDVDLFFQLEGQVREPFFVGSS